MNPEEVEGRAFTVGFGGYDRDEVDWFTREMAAELRRLNAELETARADAIEEIDPLEYLGANVTAILRTANESAAEITARAEEEVATVVAEAQARAADIVADAERHAAEIVAAAEARVPGIEAAAEEAGRNRARAAVDAEVARLADTVRQHQELRARLVEASEELQLAVLAIGDVVEDPQAVVHDAVDGVIVLD